MRSFKLKEGGFSVVELIVVVAIIAMLTAIATLSMEFVRKQQVTSATKELVADLQQARVAATSGGSGTTVVFNSATSYVAGGNARTLSSARLWVFNGTALVAPASNMITFNKFGYSNTMTIAVDSSSAPGYIRCINIGAVTVQEGFWSVSTSTCQVQ